MLVMVVAACASPPLVDPAGDPAGDVPTDETGAPLPSAGTATLRAETVVLPAATTADAIVELGRVVFAGEHAALLELVRGDVIVSGTGDGFIRRVYAVAREGDAIVVTTSPATLADAVVDATFDLAIAEPLAIAPHIDGRAGLVTAAIDGDLAIAPAIDVHFTLGPAGLERFALHVTGTGSTTVEGTVAFASATHQAWGEEHQWQTPLFRRAFALGPLPIVVVGRMTTVLAASAFVDEAVTFTNGARAELAIDAAASYAPATGWTMTDASRVDVAQIGPLHDGGGRASLSVGIDPRIELQFYGTAGPTLHLVAQAGGFGAYCGPSLLTALQAAVHGSAVFELDALVKSANGRVTLWDTRPFLDEIEQCATP